MVVRGKQLDSLADDMKSIKGALWANDQAARRIQEQQLDLDTRLTTLETRLTTLEITTANETQSD